MALSFPRGAFCVSQESNEVVCHAMQAPQRLCKEYCIVAADRLVTAVVDDHIIFLKRPRDDCRRVTSKSRIDMKHGERRLARKPQVERATRGTGRI